MDRNACWLEKRAHLAVLRRVGCRQRTILHEVVRWQPVSGALFGYSFW